MQISFDCPKCLKLNRVEWPQAKPGVMCDACGWSRLSDGPHGSNDVPKACLVCGCDDLWRQKDFSQRLGVLIVAIGILLSTIAAAYMMPGVSMIVLMVFGLADWILYLVLPDRLVCYRCHAQYRRLANLSNTAAFDLEVNERYRQEAIRLKQSGQSVPR